MNKHINSWWKYVIIGFSITSCSQGRMLVDGNLQKESIVYEVKGRQGWLTNQQLSFGEFMTNKVNRSWTKGYDFPFLIRFSGAKEKLNFQIRDAQGNQAEVFCLGKLDEQDITLFHRYFDINIRSTDAFAGTVVINDNQDFDFQVTNLNQNNLSRETEGWIKGNEGKIIIQPVIKADHPQHNIGQLIFGFEFLQNNQVVGAVETVNNGRIWLHNGLKADQRLLLASMGAALLLRSDLADHNDQTVL